MTRAATAPATTNGRRFRHDDRRRRARKLLIAVAAAIVGSQWVRILLRPHGDFSLHWLFGTRLLEGSFLYAGEMHRPYPPFWALASAPLTLLPMAVMRALLYPLGLLPLAAVVWMVHRLARRRLPLAGREAVFWSTALALGLGSRFLIRELPECGANLIIVALAWGGVFFWCRGRDRLGGVSLGLATALKCTPALLIAYFAWKRQWRIVSASLIAAAAFTLAPIGWMGPISYARHMAYWGGHVLAAAAEPNPLRGVLGDEEPWNLSLRPAIGRYLVAVPPTHKGHVDHPWRVQPLDLSPALAGWIVKAVLAGLVVAVAAAMTRRAGPRAGLTVLWEGAAVSVLMLLLSPITWRQHGVWTLPAFLLIARTTVARGRLPWSMTALLGVYVVLVLVLDRGVVGRELTILLDSYGVTAIALLCVLAATLVGRASARREELSAVASERLDLRPSAPRPHGGVATTIRAQPVWPKQKQTP